MADCRRRANVLPLGAAALAGTSLPIDRDDVAGAARASTGVAANSLDAVSDRDFAVEFAFALALIAEHLSTWAEEWILWSTDEFDFLKLPQAFCTGSSIMPQKINPDVLELIRGKTARVVGNLQTLLVLVKGLPLAYNRDLQEDKQPLFDSFDTVCASLELAAPLVAGAKLNREAIAERLDRGHLDATTLMEHLIRRGVPQRTAHGLVGRLVRKALDRGVRLSDLSLDEFPRGPSRPGRERLRRARSREGRGRHDQLRIDRARAGERASSALEGIARVTKIRRRSCACSTSREMPYPHCVCVAIVIAVLAGRPRLVQARASPQPKDSRRRRPTAIAVAVPSEKTPPEDPAVAAILATKPATPEECVRAAKMLVDLEAGGPGQGFLEEGARRQARAAATGRPGRAVRLAAVPRPGRPPALQPEAKQLGRRRGWRRSRPGSKTASGSPR